MTSWYPVMQVLMTTSPLAWAACPPRSPSSVKPSSRTSASGSDTLHHPLEQHLSATDGHDGTAVQTPAGKGGIPAPAAKGRGVDRPVELGIDQNPVTDA